MAAWRTGIAGMMAGALTIAAPAAAPAQNSDLVTDAGHYVVDRVGDFFDVFRLRIGLPQSGSAIGAKARVTALAQAGWVYFDGDYFGLDRRSAGLTEERRHEGGLSVLYASKTNMTAAWGNGPLRNEGAWSLVRERHLLRRQIAWDDGRQRPDSLGLELATPLIAVDLGLYPVEAFDFLVGFLTLDLYGDDYLRMPSVEQPLPTSPSVPDPRAPIADREKALGDRERAIIAAAKGLADAGNAPAAPAAPLELPPANTESITPAEADAMMEALPPAPPAAPEAPPAAEPQAGAAPSEAAARAAAARDAALRRQAERKAREAEEAAAQPPPAASQKDEDR